MKKAPKPASENLSPPPGGRESTANRYLRALALLPAERVAAAATWALLDTLDDAIHWPEEYIPSIRAERLLQVHLDELTLGAVIARREDSALLLRRRLWRGVKLYTRDQKALRQQAAEENRPPADVIKDCLLWARCAARRHMRAYGLDPDSCSDAAKLEDGLAASGLRLLLGSDRNRPRRGEESRLSPEWGRWQVVCLTAAPAPPQLTDGVGWEGKYLVPIIDPLIDPREPDARVDAELRHVFAVATETLRDQLRRVLAVWRKAPHLTYAEACTAAGLTPDQRKKLTSRLRNRLT